MSPRTLTRMEMAWALDAFEAIFPGPQGIGTMNVREYIQATFARIPLEPVIGLRLAIWIVALAPLFVLRRFRTLHGLTAEEREHVLVALAANPVYAVRQLVLALKAMAALLYAADPAVRARMFAPRAEALPLRKKTSVPPPPPSKEHGRAAKVA